MPHLQTDRLTIVPFTLALAEAASRDVAEVGRLLGVQVDPGWPNSDFAEVIPFIIDSRKSEPDQEEWSGLIITRANPTLIGDIGFIGQPDEAGKIEFGYGIVPAYRGQGYATEAAQAMVAWALQQPTVQCVTAECEQDNPASARVLAKVGLHQVGQQGSLLQWQLCR